VAAIAVADQSSRAFRFAATAVNSNDDRAHIAKFPRARQKRLRFAPSEIV
jgi:hypothetical protein